MHLQDFLGADEVKARLRGGPERFPHAVLLQGEEGCGKRTLARWIAASVMCTDSARRPCGGCRACLRVLEDSHPDVRWLIGTGAGNVVRVDQIRELRQDALRPPLEAPVKVYILPDAHKMNEQSQNALLKVLEEPPSYVRFILTAPAKDRLLATIVSRVQVFSVQPPAPEECAAWVMQHEPQADPARVTLLSQQHGGNIGKVLASLKETEDEPVLAAAGELLRALLAPDENPLLRILAGFSRDRVQFAAVMRRAALIMRDACTARAGVRTAIGGAPDVSGKLAQRLPQKNLLQLRQDFLTLADISERNANMTLLVTTACARLRTAAGL